MTGKVKLVSIEIEDNEHVGQKKDWYYVAMINGVSIKIDEEKEVEVNNNKIVFRLEVYEKDKVVDKSFLTEEIIYSSLKGQLISFTLKVEENRGRYAGNKAKAEFIFKIS